MSGTSFAVAGFVAMLLLIGLRMPVWLAMLLVGSAGYVQLNGLAPFMAYMKSTPYQAFSVYTLSVIPLFILMGAFAERSGLSRELFRAASALVGHRRGGLGMGLIGACTGFGAICGSSVATTATFGRAVLPELRKAGYDPGLATGMIAVGGTLGILIPPSVALVLYAIIVEGSILQMFQAAVVPGILAMAGFVAVVWALVRLNPALAPPARPMPDAERREALGRLLPVLCIFGAIILGLGFGLFTPTPAASIGVFLIAGWGFWLRLRGKGGLDLSGLGRAVRATAVTTGMIYLILFGAEVLKGFFARAGLPQAISGWAGASGLDPMLVLIVMLALLIVLGCFMESLAMILVVVPFFWPTLVALNGGEDVAASAAAFGMTNDELRIWFGILVLAVVELGLITPPVGLNVFIIAGIASHVPMATVFRGVVPFIGAEVARVGLILGLPVLALGLPRLIGG